MKFKYMGRIFHTVFYKGGWTVKYSGGILNLRPYKTEKKLIEFLKSTGAKRVK